MAGNLDYIKTLLLDYCEAELEPAKHQRGFYICPLCGSGTGRNGTAAFSINPDKIHWKCFSCNRSGDIFDLEAARAGKPLSEATRDLVARYDAGGSSASAAYDFRPAAAPAAQARIQDTDPAPVHDFSDKLAEWHTALKGSEGEAYLRRRGITEETMNRFNIGFGKDRHGRNAVVFPYNRQGTYYSMRAVYDDLPQNLKHDKPTNEVAGSEPIFNAAALYQKEPCFVVESQLCAVSIMQEGGAAIAIGGTSGIGKLRSLKDKPSALLILALDNDEPGQKAQTDLAAILRDKGISFLEYNVACDSKDPNDLLRKSPILLHESILNALEIAQVVTAEKAEELEEKEQEREKRTGPGMIDSFLQDVQTRMYEPLPTGISDIDKALEGGFMRQQLVTLGAAPGAGKTALAQWIFEGMAERGISCIFLNLEMSRNQILARSMARVAARHGHRISSVKALRGYNWTDDDRSAIMAAADEYKRTVAPFMIYNPDNVTSSIDSILEYIESEAQRAEAAGNPAPCVVLDYLQIVTGRKGEDGVELIKRTIYELKQFAVSHNTVVFLIIAHNRRSNESGSVTMESAPLMSVNCWI